MEELYSDFITITEAARLFGDALSHQTEEIADLDNRATIGLDVHNDVSGGGLRGGQYHINGVP